MIVIAIINVKRIKSKILEFFSSGRCVFQKEKSRNKHNLSFERRTTVYKITSLGSSQYNMYFSCPEVQTFFELKHKINNIPILASILCCSCFQCFYDEGRCVCVAKSPEKICYLPYIFLTCCLIMADSYL